MQSSSALLGAHGDRSASAVALDVRQRATLLCQKPDELLHGFEARAVVEEPSFAARSDEARALQLLQMKRQSGSGNLQLRADISGCVTLRTALHERAKHGQSSLLSECAQGGNGIFSIHNSKDMEISKRRQAAFSARRF